MKKSCWLIGDERGSTPLIAAQYAHLRGLELRFRSAGETLAGDLAGGSGNLIASSFDFVQRLRGSDKEALKRRVAAGATLYLRGGLHPQASFALAPLADCTFRMANEDHAQAYRFTHDEKLPQEIRDEDVSGEFSVSGADGLNGGAKPLIVAHHSDGKDRPAVFSIQCGAGTVICDLNPDSGLERTPLVGRLQDPAHCAGEVGALMAADCAAGITPRQGAVVNLMIDDRPANYDYFTTAKLRALLEHMNTLFPGVHVDFAWSPSQNHPTSSYIEVLKEFDCGFVWHGFSRSVDHQKLMDPEAELAAGQAQVEEISERYDIRFQPVMVFPYDADTRECIDVVKRANFRAIVHGPPAKSDLPACAVEPGTNGGNGSNGESPKRNGTTPVVLYRDLAARWRRERMLAFAMLGLPIIATAQPRNLSLQRIVPSWPSNQASEYFDEVLNFAALKSLSSLSLEDIAHEGSTLPPSAARLVLG